VGTGSRVEEEYVWDLTEVWVPDSFGAGVVDGRMVECPERVVDVLTAVPTTDPSCRSRRTAPPETKSQQMDVRRRRANRREESDCDLLMKEKAVRYIVVEIRSSTPARNTPS